MSKKTIVKQWIDFAETDLNSAEILFKSKSKKADKRRFRLVIWLCHQSIEKILKGIIAVKGKEVPLIHDLTRLYELAEVVLLDKHVSLLKDLNTYYIPPRYPDLRYSKPLPPFTQEAATHYLKHTKRVFQCLKKELILKK